MILAAAIKYHIEETNSEVILCGCRHPDILVQLKQLGFEPMKGYKELQIGFITHKNEFLTREEAFRHAKECGQISINTIHERESIREALFSEDLW